jgi:hypothetical protein
VVWGSLVPLAEAGDISGHVQGPDGEPVPSAVVVVYDQRLNYEYVETNAAGSFAIVDLPSNPYRVRVLPPMAQDLAEAFAPEGLHFCAADIYDVGDEPLGVEIGLDPGGVLTGVILDTLGQPIPDALVIGRSTLEGSTAQSRYAYTDATGRYTLVGLPPEQGDRDEVRLEVQAIGWPAQFLPGVYAEEEGEVFTAVIGDTTDVTTDVLLDGIAVGGAVSGPYGSVTSGTIYVYSPSQVVTTSVIDGRYEAQGLPPGEVLAWAVVPGLGNTYYPDSDRPGDRVDVPDEGDVNLDLDIEAPYESVLVGQVAGQGDLSGVTLLAYNDTSTVGIGAQADATGHFEVHGLHGGQYTLYVYASDEGLVSDFARDADGEPVVYTVPPTAASETFIVSLPEGAVLEGTITDKYTGEPVYGAYVYATGSTSGRTLATETGQDGAYVLPGLGAEPIQFFVDYSAFCPADPNWVDLYYPDELDSGFSAPVTLAAGQHLTWNAELPPDQDQDQMDDVWEADAGLDPERDDSAEDPDRDGITNLEEYHLGTDPTSEDASPGGCGCGDGRATFVVVAWPLWAWRRRRATR